jgi:hypothetical protein
MWSEMVERFVHAWVGFWVWTPIRLLQRLGLMRDRSRRKPLQPYDDGPDSAAGGVTARLPRVPPRMSPGNALTIPREDEPA